MTDYNYGIQYPMVLEYDSDYWEYSWPTTKKKIDNRDNIAKKMLSTKFKDLMGDD